MKYVNWMLVPIDYSEESKMALEAADRQAAHRNAGLILLHVRKLQMTPRTRLTTQESGLERWGRFIKHTPPENVAYITCTGDPAD